MIRTVKYAEQHGRDCFFRRLFFLSHVRQTHFRTELFHRARQYRPCAQAVHSSGSDSPTEDAEEDKTVRPDRANESGSPSVDAEAAPTASGSKQDAASARVGDAIADTGLGSADVAVSSNDVLKSKSNEIIWDDL